MLRDTVSDVCAWATRDTDRYVLRERLIAENPELADRAARKHRRLVEPVGELLRQQGASAETAALAPQVALACYQAGHQVAGGDPAALWPSVSAAFDQLGVVSGQT
ncbi:hypothetical protein ACIBQ1_13920 [Nonomuraea sp. NPDC050153]|uniref:hypothetical protein n=1 Tax=Nonomuraea sp. NPDC050153 TaxID=3364359 RepID=UPI00378E2181